MLPGFIPMLGFAGGAPPAQVAYGASGGRSADQNVAYPSGIVAGMGLLVGAVAGNSVGSVLLSTPVGWTLIANVDYTTTVFETARLFGKIADGSETGTLGLTGIFDTGCNGWMIRTTGTVSGFESGNAVDTSASASSIPMNSVTTSAALGMAAAFLVAHSTATTVASATGESGGDWTEALAESSGTFGPMDWQTAQMAAAGTISGGTAALGAARTHRVCLSCGVKA